MTVGLLDKLSWAGMSVEVRIKRAAAMLRINHGCTSWNIFNDPETKRKVRKYVHLTCPEKGKIMERDAAIKDEICRQLRIVQGRHRPHEETTTYYQDYNEGCDDEDREWAKTQIIMDFGRRMGIDDLKSFRRVGDLWLLFTGHHWSNITGMAVRKKDGSVTRIVFPEREAYATEDEALAKLPLHNIDDEGLAALAVQGATLSVDMENFRTNITLPDGDGWEYYWETNKVERETEVDE